MSTLKKDELLILHLDMCTYVESHKILKESPSHKALREKIQMMIDNYCDHKWFAAKGQFNLGYPKCEKCGATQ